MTRFCRQFIQRLRGDRRGAVLIYTAIAAPVLIGFVGMSVDIGYWYAKTRHLQSVADSAAIAGALENLRSDGDDAAIQAAAEVDAANHDFAATNGRVIDANNPPEVSNFYAGFSDMVEVVVSEPGSSFIAQALFDASPTFTARAVAKSDTNDTCVWSLSPDASSAVSVQGGAQVSLGCGVLVNSNDPAAISQGGSSCLNTTEIKVVGGSSGSCLNPPPDTGTSPVIDPLGALDFEALYEENIGPFPPTPCTNNPIQVNGGQSLTLDPGCYGRDIRINTSGTVTLNSGVYVFDGAELNIQAQATVTGEDVVIYLTKTGLNGTGDETISISAGAVVDLDSPDDGPFAGILIVADRDSPTTADINLTGGATQYLEGIVYVPNRHVKFAGGSAFATSTTLLIADTVAFVGGTDIGDFENTPVLSNPLLFTSYLVE
jgi:Flp pilus assembly protein TadG